MTVYTEANPLIIDICGDSTIAGWSDSGRRTPVPPVGTPDAGGYVAVPAPQGLQALLQAKYGSIVVVNNNGHNATKCVDWQNGTTGVPMPWAQYVTSTPASIIVLCLGINDTIDELTSIYPTLVSQAQAAGKKFVMQTPNTTDVSWNPVTPRVIEEYKIAAANNLLVIDFNGATLAMGDTWLNNNLSYMYVGTYWISVHPTQDGYTLMSQVEFQTLDSIVGEMLGYPTGDVSCDVLPQGVVTTWNVSNNGWSAINVLDSNGIKYWDGGPPVAGVNYLFNLNGNDGAAIFALPPGTYVIALYGWWNQTWLFIEKKTVTVNVPSGGS